MRRVSNRQLAVFAFLLGVSLAAAVLSSCSKDETGGTGPEKPVALVLDGIILDPRSPGPGDTLLATAIVSSDTTYPGDFASYKWTSNAGTFLEDNLSTVRWVAPDTSRVFQLSVSASNTSSSASTSGNVFVSRIVTRVPSGGGAMQLSTSGDSLYYMGSTLAPTTIGFNGFGVSRYAMGTSSMLMMPNGTSQLALSRDFTNVAYIVPEIINTHFVVKINYTNLNTSATTVIPGTPFFQRPPVFLEPSFSVDGTLLTYQVWYPDLLMPPSQAGTDTFVVAIWDLATRKEKRVAVQGTRTGAFGLNFHPSFSPDGAHLVYLADRSGTNNWELYSLPVTGGTVPVDSVVAPTQLTFSGGTMSEINPLTGQANGYAKVWNGNPTESILAILDGATKLHLVPVSGAGDVLVSVPGLVRGFAWSPTGQEVAVTTGRDIYRVSKAGDATLLHEAMEGDNVSRLSWSSDEQFLVYAVRRQSKVWYELLDLTGSLGLGGPISVSPSEPQGAASIYDANGWSTPVWDPDEPTAYLMFFASGESPSIATVSFDGLAP